MTFEEQVKEIIRILSPENSEEQADAVFLVQRELKKLRGQIKEKDKQIALVEATLETAQKARHDAINEKLESEARIRKEAEDKVAEAGAQQPAPVKPGPGKGRTL